MPYVDTDTRVEIDMSPIGHADIFDAGQLNYGITSLCIGYLGNDPNYQRYNEVIGVLECAKQELYRKAVAPYEETKIKENGDITWASGYPT